MKKLIFTTILSITFLSCEKKVSDSEKIGQNTDSIVTEESIQEVSKNPLIIKSISDVSEDLQKKNDTLYITNFFATWCGPCVREIPHFKNKIETLQNQPVKITFVSVDNKDVWNTDVEEFVDVHGIRNNTVLLDGEQMDANFFSNNFKEWKGDAIPFTFMRKGSKTNETLGMMSAEDLDAKITSLQQ